MPKTVQIRDIDDDVYETLKRRAAEDGITVPELLRRTATDLASRPSMKQWLSQVRRGPFNDVPTATVVAIMDEWRGPWPDADR